MPSQNHYTVFIYGYTSFLANALIETFKETNVEFFRLQRDFDFKSSVDYAKKYPKTRNILVSMAWTSNRSNDYQVSEDNMFWISRSLEMAEWCRRHNFELMIPGSCLEYSDQAQSNYVVAKRALYNAIVDSDYGITFYWPRIFYAFSVEYRRPRILKGALGAKESNRDFELRFPEEKHDYIEVSDVARQLKSMLDLSKTGTWDVGTGLLHSNKDLIFGVGARIAHSPELYQSEDLLKLSESWNHPAQRMISDQVSQISSTLEFFSRI